ncbi:MMPL family transporter [Paenibacillus sp. IHBB 10380]|uniref:MMPL family transporter n=1 Tax=Paenibacillus sp. IHBB 10380 TaxID=1566358 RepID=UPI0005CF96D1|nr:MMPL family transporter [Paenibacillus sp. IHBB 10380]AJS59285.1 membrane protein [Paenibacillus sp. IHBB 10380]
MKIILKARWGIIVLWLIATVVLVLTAPPVSDLIRENGQIDVPNGYSSTEATRIMDEVAKESGGSQGTQIALVFHDVKGLDDSAKKEIEQAFGELEKNKENLSIESIVNPFEQPEIASKLIAKNGNTIMTSISVDLSTKSMKEIEVGLHTALESISVPHYLTGKDQINEDTIISSQEGLKKSEYITVVFILIILFAVFRSFVAPFVPLLTVGISYITSQSIVAFLVNWFGFPISTFTQIFMVAVMFGIGTDYCILLISRFKEELGRQDDIGTAIVETYRTAGKTVFFSGLAVLVGFLAIGFAKFTLYQSAVAVAVGIAVMMVALVTIVPFFMAVLGRKLFWPMKKSIEHKENQLWGAAGTFSLKRPWAALLIIAIIVTPFLVTYDGKLSFNSLEEIGDKYESVEAFNIISDSFGPGESLPGQIVIKNDDKMDTTEYMALAEKISREVQKVNGVAGVRSLTRPMGDVIEDFQIPKQLGTLSDGLSEGGKGIDQIQTGLADASRQLSDNEPKLKEAVASTGKLSEGTGKLKDGISELGTGLSKIQQGIKDGSMGAGELKKGLERAKKSAVQLAKANEQLLASYGTIGEGLGALDGGLKQLQQQMNGVAHRLNQLEASFTSLEASHPELLQDKDYLTIKGTVTESGKGVMALSAGLIKISSQLEQATAGLKQANQGYAGVSAGQKALSKGFDQFITGIGKLQSGLNQAADGQGQIVDQVPQIEKGLSELQSGQNQLQDGFGQLTGQISELTDGLDQSAKGLSQISGGITTAQQYLTQIEDAPDQELSGWYIPEEVLKNADFTQVFDTYLSPQRKVMTIDVIFAENPYGTEAIGSIEDIRTAVDRAVVGTKLENAEIAISGVTSTFADLQQISNADYTRTVILMLGGIFIILVIMLRSIIMPIYLIGSLVLTYFTALGVTEAIFVNMLDYSGISWVTPFFGFVMLMALGVDYSIFLMDRFNENKSWNVQEAILHAMRNMGTVILSAAVILSGTFAAMYPSGVLSMLQIATVVLVGLGLYSLLILPFFVPVMVKIFGRANWWPFPNKHEKSTESESRSIHM